MNKELYEELGEFASATFVASCPVKQLIKLKEEIDEALAAPDDISEWADCYIALSIGAYMQGISCDDVIAAIRAKFEILKGRDWELDSAGIYQHIKK